MADATFIEIAYTLEPPRFVVTAATSDGQKANGNPSLKLCDEILEKVKTALHQKQKKISINVQGSLIVADPSFIGSGMVAMTTAAASASRGKLAPKATIKKTSRKAAKKGQGHPTKKKRRSG